MTPEKIKEALMACRAAIAGARTPAYKPAELAEPYKRALHSQLTPRESARHLLFMCDKAIEFVDAGKIDKANRWLGFLQGAIWLMGIASIDQMKKMNCPDTAPPVGTVQGEYARLWDDHTWDTEVFEVPAALLPEHLARHLTGVEDFGIVQHDSKAAANVVMVVPFCVPLDDDNLDALDDMKEKAT